MSRAEDYAGREQSLVKHYILQKYLERFAHIIGSWSDTITYVDCFSGPWQSNNENLADTSFAIALGELRKARTTHAALGKTLRIRCLFLEQDAVAHARLRVYADQQTDVVIQTRNAEVLSAIPDILQFIQAGGPKSFPFVFIDPTGWDGFDLNRIGPLLQHRPGEVLINFMTQHIRRFVSRKEKRQGIRDSLHRLFGTDEVFSRVIQLTGPQDREDELFTSYATRVREVGKFEYACPAVVLHPTIERTYFHLIYATRHRKGVEVFKKVEKEAFEVMEEIRAEAAELQQAAKTGQRTLFADSDQPPSHRAVMLRERYLAEVWKRVENLCAGQKRVPFDAIWDTALAFPLVWDSDVKELIGKWKKAGRVRVTGLKPKQRVPQWEEGHIIEFLR